MTSAGGANAYGSIFSIDTNGTGFKKLLNFTDTNGASPLGSLTLFGKELFGMASSGGANNSGCIFSIDTNGKEYKKLFDFNGINGNFPGGDLTLSGDTLYGMTEIGGAHNYGVIFKLDTGTIASSNEITSSSHFTIVFPTLPPANLPYHYQMFLKNAVWKFIM